MPEITRYNRGPTSYTPLVEAGAGELMLARDVLPIVEKELPRLEGVVKDLNASVEDLTRILADKNELVGEYRALCDSWDTDNTLLRKRIRVITILDFILVGCIVFTYALDHGWW